MLMSKGMTSETRIIIPAIDHDKAWRKVAIVAAIAIKLPIRRSGLDGIGFTYDNLNCSALQKTEL